MKFDISISVDCTEYLTPQIFLLIDTLKNNLPEDTILHVTTNRPDNDPALKFIKSNINSKIYKKAPLYTLKSRCSYLMHSFEVETDADWIIKMDIDNLVLKSLNEFDKYLRPRTDILISPENRRVIPNDNLEKRIWRNIYNRFNVDVPDWMMKFVEEGEGLPLFNTGVIALRTKYIDKVNEFWIPRTMMAEDWMMANVHPNEQAFTSIILENGWNFKYLPNIFNWNPIGQCRDGIFPSIKLRDDCKVPNDCVLIHYHKPQWIWHISEKDNRIRDIIQRNKEHIPDEWWNLPKEIFMERI